MICSSKMGMKSVSFLAVSVLVFFLLEQVTSSAIPMWEFLTKDEKMNHLHRIFSQQVSEYCLNSPLPDCTKNLMIIGERNLVNMSNNDLDNMDPYQHAAKDIIWQKLSNGVATSRTEYERDDSLYSNDADTLGVTETGNNRLMEESVQVKNKDDLLPAERPGPYLMGPLVVRVLPDGRPVPGDKYKPLPKDEDLDDLQIKRIPFVDHFDWKTRRPSRASTSYNMKPIRYTKNTLPSSAFDYPRRSGNFADIRGFQAYNEIPRYRRYFRDFANSRRFEHGF